MQKQLTIFLILSVLAVSVSAATDENCKDHPWAKRNVVEKFATKFDAKENADIKKITTVFNAASTATASTAWSATDHALVPEKWRTADAKTCCTKDVYDAILKVPGLFIDHVSKNPSPFIRILAGLTKGIAKCGKRKVRKGSDGEAHDVERMTAMEILQRVKVPSATEGDSDADTTEDVTIPEETTTTTVTETATVTATATATGTGTETATESGTAGAAADNRPKKFGIQYLKDFYINKAKIFVAWVQFNRGSLLFLCRLPSAAKAALKGGADSGALQVHQTSWDKLTKTYKDALKEIRTALGGFAEVIKFAFRAFGSKKCENAAKKIMKDLAKLGPCGKGKCKGFFESGIKPRPLDFRLLKFLIGKPGQNKDFEGGKLSERPSGSSQFGKKLRVLQTDDEAEPATIADTDANGVSNVEQDSDKEITAGGPFKADGTCKEAGCDAEYKAQEDAQFNEQGAVTKDGKPLPAETTDDAAGSSVILTLGATLIALIALVL